MIYKCSWSILGGLSLDEPIDPNSHTALIDRGFQSNGIIDDTHTVYYIKPVNGSRDIAIDKLRGYIEKFMKNCIIEYDEMINTARNDWKNCK
jgi:hypothetical protein